MDQWNIEPATRRCAASGQELAEGQEYYGVLYETSDGFRREDYAVEAWTGSPPGAFCFFKSRVPVKRQKQRLFIDDDALIDLFASLADAPEAAKLHLRFVLALILMRKRLLKYEETTCTDGHEYWTLRAARQPSEGTPAGPDTCKVLNPHLDDAQIEAVSGQLGAVLLGQDAAGIGEFVDTTAKPGTDR